MYVKNAGSSFVYISEYFVEDIQTPLFMVQSGYDSYQIYFSTQHDESAHWSNCYFHGEANCTPCELKNIKKISGQHLWKASLNFDFRQMEFSWTPAPAMMKLQSISGTMPPNLS